MKPTKKNAIRYIIPKGPVAAALVLLCFLFSCVSNQILDIKKNGEYEIGDSYLLVNAPKGYCINQATRTPSKNSLQFFLTDCIGTVSSASLKRRPVSSIISVNVLYKPGLKSFHNISGLVKNAGGIENLESVFSNRAIKIRKSSLKDSVLFLSLENSNRDVGLDTGKSFFKALTLRNNVLITVTSYGFSQKPTNREAHRELENKLKAVIKSIKIFESDSSVSF